MALTSDEESKVKQIITAFENGKRLSDLPEATGTNPFGMYTEVLDTDGESKKAALASMLPYLEEQCAYGIEFDTAVSSPACTRIGSSGLHKRLPVHSRMRGVLLDDDGNVVEYLDPQDWTGNVRDGSRGQVMVEIPMHYRRFETDGTKRRVKLSEYPLPGYHCVPTAYVSAYEAAMQRSSGKLASVVNSSPDYRGGFAGGAQWDGTYRTLIGRPVSAINRAAARSAARKRKAGSVEWNCMTYGLWKTVYWLYVVEYASLDSQAAYDAALTDDGFRQGGLGQGVTTLQNTADWSWDGFNDENPFVPCGLTDRFGNRTGVGMYTMADAGGGRVFAVSVPRYRGLENPFGHIWSWLDGINVRASASGQPSMVYVSDNPGVFNDTDYDGFRHVGDTVSKGGYVREIIFGEGGEIMPLSVDGGSSSTYFCDQGEGKSYDVLTLCGVLAGGRADFSSQCGLALLNFANNPSILPPTAGTRLCFIPASSFQD